MPFTRRRPSRALLVLATTLACVAWPVAGMLWFRFDERGVAASVALLGLSMGPCLAAYALAPRKRKQALRKLTLITGGLSILAFPLLAGVNVDLEGFFMLLLLGTAGAAIGHTLITVIAGPMLFGRVLCGWGCWRGMVLEFLPVGHSSRRRGRFWRVLPYLGVAASITTAAAFAYLLRGGIAASATIVAVYYAASIGLAFGLKDARAFCKYLCPTSAILRLTSRASVLAITPDRNVCNDCGACTRICPMNIDIAAFARQGRPVRSGDCIVCQRCAHACPIEVLRFGNRFRSLPAD